MYFFQHRQCLCHTEMSGGYLCVYICCSSLKWEIAPQTWPIHYLYFYAVLTKVLTGMSMVSGKRVSDLPASHFWGRMPHFSILWVIVQLNGTETLRFIISPLVVTRSPSLFLLTEIRCLIPVTLLLRGLSFLPLCVCGGAKVGLGVRPNLNPIKSPLFLIHPILLTAAGYSCLCVRSCECCFVAHINDSELVRLSLLWNVKQVY